jgi:hypothetical protein
MSQRSAVCGCCVWVVGALCAGAVCGVRLSVGPFKFDGIFLNFVLSFIGMPQIGLHCVRKLGISIEVLSQKRGS